MPREQDNKSFQTIFDCVKQANVEQLESFVRRGTSINEVDKSKDKFTPLHLAAYYGSLECLHWLLWQEANTSITTPKGWTPAHVAAIRGQYSCIQAFIKNGVNMNVTDNRSQTPAHLAATHGHSQTLQGILRSGANITLQDSNGWTPVHSAAYHGFLKTAGGKLDDHDNDGNTPAHLAAMEGHLPCLKYILSNATNTSALLSSRNDQGDTPKTLAQQFFKDEIVEYLEAVEWDRDHPEQAENLAFPAHVAAFNGDLDHVRLLVEQGVINVNERDDKGSTVLHKAAGQGHIHVVEWLIENGADAHTANGSGETARDVAKRFSQLACVKLLEMEVASDEELNAEKRYIQRPSQKDQVVLSGEQKKEAKARAKKRLEETNRQLVIARSNYLQLGGRLEDTLDQELRGEQAKLKDQERTITELQDELHYERLRREKLETQLDHTRLELEKTTKSNRENETKVLVLERYLQQITKKENEEAKKHVKKTGGSVKTRPKSPSANPRREERESNRSPPPVSSYRRNSNSNVVTPSSSQKSQKQQNILDNLTPSQAKELRQAFEELDRNGSGSISRRELKQAFRYLEIRASDDEIDIIMNQMDSNDDGLIDFYEFARVMARNYYKKNTRDDIREAFKKFDLNNSGKISAEEMRIVLSKMYRNISRSEIEDLIRKVDANNDGHISIDEFIDFLNL